MSPSKPPVPICKAFLFCDRLSERGGKLNLEGLVDLLNCRSFPSARPFGMYARLSSGHGYYQVEVQLHDAKGTVLWRDGLSKLWHMPDPLKSYNLRMEICPVFQAPGDYTFVLVANGEELARETFYARLLPQVTAQ